MKRYYTPDIVFGPVSEDEEVHSVYKASEVQALLRAVAEEVGKMEHSKDCDCIPDPADFLDRPEDLCNCPKSRALALLEVE